MYANIEGYSIVGRVTGQAGSGLITKGLITVVNLAEFHIIGGKRSPSRRFDLREDQP
jgi:hypothetical protein